MAHGVLEVDMGVASDYLIHFLVLSQEIELRTMIPGGVKPNCLLQASSVII